MGWSDDDIRAAGTHSPWACGFPPGGCRQSPGKLQSSAVGRSKGKFQDKFVLRSANVRPEVSITHGDAGVVASHGHVVRASGGDQTHGEHHQGQGQQGHRHPQGRLPPPQVPN